MIRRTQLVELAALSAARGTAPVPAPALEPRGHRVNTTYMMVIVY
jgi:hypothetical protein